MYNDFIAHVCSHLVVWHSVPEVGTGQSGWQSSVHYLALASTRIVAYTTGTHMLPIGGPPLVNI